MVWGSDGNLFEALDERLQRRYFQVVNEHSHVVNHLASGISALPKLAKPFASTQGLWRFFSNPEVTLPALIEPIHKLARETLIGNPSRFALIVHDWSMLNYSTHSSKQDRYQRSHATDLGYDASAALLLEASEGAPVALMELSLRTSKKMLSTRASIKKRPCAHIDQVGAVMEASSTWGLDRTAVHLIDREGDSVAHFREWSQAGHRFLVRADDDRRVTWQGQSILFKELVSTLTKQDAFLRSNDVKYKGTWRQFHYAETSVVLDRPGKKRQGKRRIDVPGEPLPMRLVITRVVDAKGKVLAQWLLLSNVESEVSPLTLATWYYWRWRIENYFKLLKGAGLNVESWEQQSGEAIARRIVVASMAIITVWLLLRSDSDQAKTIRLLLIRLSGRQMKWKVESTAPALLAGMHSLLAMLNILEEYSADELRRIIKQALPFRFDTS